ncbi:DegT/DnrJ/EryC1/StrS family aminotransferase [Bacteroides fragilis]|uniref:DegT/DnrJ/EryC1/StrS family aminotransferase n=1 Tax=Bacteroides TaxID=816 RepID=UPI0022AA3BB2|nr:DegT/DnrJ/EryC1/StrS family aminotransferase [Bacteroides fragilis]MCZ2661996.1 DegT/DnrJ/EryC1/StrS family aminotransferase [Bacteroides fragilis]
MELRNIPFSSSYNRMEAVANEIHNAILGGWITTGAWGNWSPECCHTDKLVCLNSATAAIEMISYILGIGNGDEVIIVPVYTYTAITIKYVGATRQIPVDVQEDYFKI